MSKLSEEQLKCVFHAADTNKDRFLTLDELELAMGGVGIEISRDHLARLFTSADAKCRGYLDFDQFISLLKPLIRTDKTDQDIRLGLRMIDADGKGKIDRDVLMHALSTLGSLTENEVVQLLAVAKMEHQQDIDYSKFLDAVLQD
eukprot:c5509_g1_i2.p1 GENE.c5509_g1_i2~~c5509_g1_i2.p1  ORF type:complete len:145 (+),score=34.72 c5509_g1_i2:81-515(+)